MKKKVLEKIGIVNFPPILEPVWYILWLPIMAVYMSCRFVLWLIGFWTCDECHRMYWLKDNKNSRYVNVSWDDSEKITECDACVVARKLIDSK